MSVREGFRPIEEGVHTDFRESMSYADYLDLDQLLAAQHLRSDSEVAKISFSSWLSVRNLIVLLATALAVACSE